MKIKIYSETSVRRNPITSLEDSPKTLHWIHAQLPNWHSIEFIRWIVLTECEGNNIKQSRLPMSIHQIQSHISDEQSCIKSRNCASMAFMGEPERSIKCQLTSPSKKSADLGEMDYCCCIKTEIGIDVRDFSYLDHKHSLPTRSILLESSFLPTYHTWRKGENNTRFHLIRVRISTS